MVRFPADENFSGDIVRTLKLRRPGLDLVRVQDVGLNGRDDPAVLAWAAGEDRIVVTHDRATMPDFAYDRVAADLSMPAMFVLNDRIAVRDAVEGLLLVDSCSEHPEWAGIVVRLPL